MAEHNMTSTDLSFPVPHAQLTPIQGKPTAAAIRQLKKELYTNARSIHSNRGGGVNSHLRTVMPTAAYVIQAGAAFNKPIILAPNQYMMLQLPLH
jgi:hypothetical protein